MKKLAEKTAEKIKNPAKSSFGAGSLSEENSNGEGGENGESPIINLNKIKLHINLSEPLQKMKNEIIAEERSFWKKGSLYKFN